MDMEAATIFFAIGLGITLVVGNMWKWGKKGTGLESYPVKNGTVRLDVLAGYAPVEEPAGTDGEVEEIPVDGDAAEDRVAATERRRRPAHKRPRRSKDQ